MENAENAAGMTCMSDEASNVMPSVSDLPQTPHREVESAEKKETLTSEDVTQEGDQDDGSEEGDVSSDSHEDGDSNNSIEYAERLIEKGINLKESGDYASAVDCLSRSLEIQVGHYGELAPECLRAYYEYGCALLRKAQQETDPLSSVPTKEYDSIRNGEHSECSVVPAAVDSQEENLSAGSAEIAEASSISAVIQEKRECMHNNEVEKLVEAIGEENEAERDVETNDQSEADEDESDLDLAWKSLDIARAIAEKQSMNSIMVVDILSTLAEVSLEREDIETSLSDCKRALSMLHKLAEPDNRYIAELNFRLCLTLELASRVKEALPYCREAISICRLRRDRLKNEISSAAGFAAQTCISSLENEQNKNGHPEPVPGDPKIKEINTLSELLIDLEKKLEDLEQAPMDAKEHISNLVGTIYDVNGILVNNPPRMTSTEIGRITSTKAGFDSPSVSTGFTKSVGSVTDLGVVGRGVKRMHEGSGELPAKKSFSN